MVGNILKQQKRPHKKVQIDLELLDDPQVPGDRQANLWLCYDPSKAPQNEADWNEPRFVHKTHYGYYKWPPKMEVYAASTEQPPHNRSVESLSAGEQEIHKFFRYYYFINVCASKGIFLCRNTWHPDFKLQFI